MLAVLSATVDDGVLPVSSLLSVASSSLLILHEPTGLGDDKGEPVMLPSSDCYTAFSGKSECTYSSGGLSRRAQAISVYK